MFYEGPKGDENGLLLVALLWALPMVWLAFTVVWWLLRSLGLFEL
jgi:hypothetical protein